MTSSHKEVLQELKSEPHGQPSKQINSIQSIQFNNQINPIKKFSRISEK